MSNGTYISTNIQTGAQLDQYVLDTKKEVEDARTDRQGEHFSSLKARIDSIDVSDLKTEVENVISEANNTIRDIVNQYGDAINQNKLEDELKNYPKLSNGQISAKYLPSYVDDVIEGYYQNNKFYETDKTTLIKGETGKIYVDLETNSVYRFSGTSYIEISNSIGIFSGASESNAGKAGLVPAPIKGDQNSFLKGDATWTSITKETVGLSNVDNTSDIDKPISTATQNALDNKVDRETGKGLSTNDYTTAEKNKLAIVEVHKDGTAPGAEIFNTYRGINKNTASGNYSHAEGNRTTASGEYSHAEGYGTTASGEYSHAEGNRTTASGAYSHAEGEWSVAKGDWSHAEGQYTIANEMQSVIGSGNIEDDSSAFIIGNGDASNRSNALTVSWVDGTIYTNNSTYGFNSETIQNIDTNLANKITAVPGWEGFVPALTDDGMLYPNGGMRRDAIFTAGEFDTTDLRTCRYNGIIVVPPNNTISGYPDISVRTNGGYCVQMKYDQYGMSGQVIATYCGKMFIENVTGRMWLLNNPSDSENPTSTWMEVNNPATITAIQNKLIPYIGCTSTTAGVTGLVPAAPKNERYQVLTNAGTWENFRPLKRYIYGRTTPYTAGNPAWFKIGTGVINGSNQNLHAHLRFYDSFAAKADIYECVISARRNTETSFGVEAHWINGNVYQKSVFNKYKLIWHWNADNTVVTMELWAFNDGHYSTVEFEVLTERSTYTDIPSYITSPSAYKWTWYNSPTAVASYPSGTGYTEVPIGLRSVNLDKEINYIFNTSGGGKNLIDIPYVPYGIYNNGITYIHNTDGTITVNGTANGDSTYIIIEGTVLHDTIPIGDYIISGVPDGASSTTYFMKCYKRTSTESSAIYKDTQIHCDYTTHSDANIAIIIKDGTTVHDLVFKPMLRNANINDSTFVPYIPTNTELYGISNNKLGKPEQLLHLANSQYIDSTDKRTFEFNVPGVEMYSHEFYIVCFWFVSPYTTNWTTVLRLGSTIGRHEATTSVGTSLTDARKFEVHMDDTGYLTISEPTKILSWKSSSTPQVIDNPSMHTTCVVDVYGFV